MGKKTLGILVTLIMLLSLFTPVAASPSLTDNLNLMPANEGKIQDSLQAQGVIPANASPEQAKEIVDSYLQQKFGNKIQTQYPSPKDTPSAQGQEKVKQNENNFKGLNNSNGSAADNQNVPNAAPLPLTKKRETGNILVLLVEFGEEPGPLAGNLPQPEDPDQDYWVENFDNQHYTDLLFDRTPGANSMANYYLAQSDGRFTVDGGVYGWITLPYPESWYGQDDASGIDNANGPAWRVVQDTVQAAAEQGLEIPYADYDSDGDGYVDSLMVVHAGAGQEGGGGAEGDDAIWSHSWFVNYSVGGVETWDGTWVGPYTIEPEDGALGVFAHEYGHQLGLPDLYDTTYIGESSTGFYTLMSSGSWLGKPLGTQPANLDIWSKMVLGWAPDLVEISQGSSGQKDVLIHSAETYATFAKGLKINLPQHPATTEINTPYEGSYEWWSTMGDDLSTTMTRPLDLSSMSTATLTFKTWYDIEYDYDYGFVEVSTDNGATFVKLPGNITRDIGNGIPGIDGTSTGWVDAEFDLSQFAGQQVLLRFHYLTDGGWVQKGWAIDNISVTGDNTQIFTDGAESGLNGWTLEGFRSFAGSETVYKNHYYLSELVRPYGTNVGLDWAYNYYGTEFERFAYEPGVLLWYRDTAFADNNVGVHPGQGRLLLVDSHNDPLLQANNKPFRTRIQVYDAPFGLEPTTGLALHGKDGALVEFPSLAAVSSFDDSQSYWNPAAPFNSAIVPTYGVKMTVKGISDDGSAARLKVNFR